MAHRSVAVISGTDANSHATRACTHIHILRFDWQRQRNACRPEQSYSNCPNKSLLNHLALPKITREAMRLFLYSKLQHSNAICAANAPQDSFVLDDLSNLH
jgi:hypothetical protein